MTYRIKPQFLDRWEGGDSPSNPDRIITEEEVLEKAKDWEMPVAYVKLQLTPISKEEAAFNATLELLKAIGKR